MLDPRKRTALLGFAFMLFLFLSSVENTFLFNILIEIPQNPLITVAMLFLHNVLVISLILLGMTFYVNLVALNLFKKEKYANIVLEHPGTFALLFTFIILFSSILRGSNLLDGVSIELLPRILLVSAPIGIIEGCGIYLTIKKTLSRAIRMKDLVCIYGIFFLAAIMEVSFMNLLISVFRG